MTVNTFGKQGNGSIYCFFQEMFEYVLQYLMYPTDRLVDNYNITASDCKPDTRISTVTLHGSNPYN